MKKQNILIIGLIIIIGLITVIGTYEFIQLNEKINNLQSEGNNTIVNNTTVVKEVNKKGGNYSSEKHVKSIYSPQAGRVVYDGEPITDKDGNVIGHFFYR